MENPIKRPLPYRDTDTDQFGARNRVNLDKRIDHKSDFELAYLRWRYFIKTDNPSDEVLNKFIPAAAKCAWESYRQNYVTYKNSGMEIDDVKNIAFVHLVSYLGLYSIEYAPNNKELFLHRTETGQLVETRREDLSNAMAFMKQRLYDLIRVCNQKNKSIFGDGESVALFKKTKPSAPAGTGPQILKTPAKFGYTRVGSKESKELKKSVNMAMPIGEFSHNGVQYFFFYQDLTPVWLSDYENGQGLRVFNPTEESIEEKIETHKMMLRKERLLSTYEAASTEKKRKMLTRAMRFFNKKGMREEFLVAQKLLSKLK
jgi:hypothetical protein